MNEWCVSYDIIFRPHAQTRSDIQYRCTKLVILHMNFSSFGKSFTSTGPFRIQTNKQNLNIQAPAISLMASSNIIEFSRSYKIHKIIQFVGRSGIDSTFLICINQDSGHKHAQSSTPSFFPYNFRNQFMFVGMSIPNWHANVFRLIGRSTNFIQF